VLTIEDDCERVCKDDAYDDEINASESILHGDLIGAQVEEGQTDEQTKDDGLEHLGAF